MSANFGQKIKSMVRQKKDQHQKGMMDENSAVKREEIKREKKAELKSFFSYCLLSAVLLDFMIECLSRRSLIEGIEHMVRDPLVFWLNAMIILTSLSVACFFPKRKFVMVLISVIWAGLGITNCVMHSFRVTPLSAIDFKLLPSVFHILNVYLNHGQMILIGIALIVMFTLLVFMYKKVKKERQIVLYALMLTVILINVSVISTNILKRTNVISGDFPNLSEAYFDYGFAYCFIVSIVDRGVDEPEAYSAEVIDQLEEEIEELADELAETEKNIVRVPDTVQIAEQNGELEVEGSRKKIQLELEQIRENREKYPNIIFVQLESFVDMGQIKTVEISDNPTPVFCGLKKKYGSGFLSVPTIGAGTVNTEFEILTGMDIDFFGAGEYPYTTILQETTCESIPYNLKPFGYSSQVIHNNTATFYDRNKVFCNLGFDTFTSVEFMKNIEYNQTGWAKDSILTSWIFDALNSTKNQDFIYTITVQAHGKYPREKIENLYGFTAEGMIEDTELNAYEYYVGQLSRTDCFLGDLISKLAFFSEPTVVVAYGDHYPNFALKDEDVVSGNLFQTEYIIWSNYGLEAEDRDIEAFQLSAYVLGLLGIDEGVLTKLHQTNYEEEEYLQNLELLEYDMLYGENNIYNGEKPYQPTVLKMGIDEIVVTGYSVLESNIYVYGQNFTKWSEVYAGEENLKTVYIDDRTLMVSCDEKDFVGDITVKQVDNEGVILGTSKAYVVNSSDVTVDQ